jgi:hypothetical protein
MRKHLSIYFALVLSLLIMAGYFNFRTDPYGYWGQPLIDGFNTVKPVQVAHVMTRMRMAMDDQKPEMVILGTSRAGQFGVSFPEFRSMATYNWHLPAAPIGVTANQLQFAYEQGRLKSALVVLDFFAFNTYSIPPAGMDDGSPIAEKKYEVALNIKTLRDSIKTIRQNRKMAKPSTQPVGHALALTNLRFVSMEMNRVRDAFTRTEEGFAKNVYYPRPYHRFGFVNQFTGHSTFEDYRRLLSFAYSHGSLDLKMVIGPSHARLWEVVYAAGLWHKWEEWKRELVKINIEEATKAGKQPFVLWDFSGYNQITTEPIPDQGASMQFFIESSHYNANAAAIVAKRVYGSNDIPALFGENLNQVNIEDHLNAICAGRQKYIRENLRDIMEVHQAVRRSGYFRPSVDACSRD